MSMPNPAQVAIAHKKRIQRERDEILIRGPVRPSYSTWTGKPSRVKDKKKGK